MTEDEDFVDLIGEPTPELQRRRQEQARKEAFSKEATVINKRWRMYREVFSAGPTRQEAIDYVINDLISHAFVFQSAPPQTLERIEGRRETMYRILGHTGLDARTLLTQYVIETQRVKDDD